MNEERVDIDIYQADQSEPLNSDYKSDPGVSNGVERFSNLSAIPFDDDDEDSDEDTYGGGRGGSGGTGGSGGVSGSGGSGHGGSIGVGAEEDAEDD